MTTNQTDEIGAIHDVLAERQRQIEKGYTPEHDDQHTPGQIMSYGGLIWHVPFYDLASMAESRAAMVRMAACIVAGIEWLDRDAERRTPSGKEER